MFTLIGLARGKSRVTRAPDAPPSQRRRPRTIKGPDTIVVRHASRDVDSALGVFDGLVEPGYLGVAAAVVAGT